MKKLVDLAVLVLVGGLVSASSAVAGDTICPPDIIDGTHDNVIAVGPGSVTFFCRIDGATVNGNVKALEDAWLVMGQLAGNPVHGSIYGDKAELVNVINTTVGGNITIKEGETNDPPFFDALVCGVTVTDGNVTIEKMTGTLVVGPFASLCGTSSVLRGNLEAKENVIPASPRRLAITGNVVGQNLQVQKNTGPGSKVVAGNTVGENLQCKENDPPPSFTGGPNMAGKAEGQCF